MEFGVASMRWQLFCDPVTTTICPAAAGPAESRLSAVLPPRRRRHLWPTHHAAVREFQRRAGLVVDGIAGPQSLGRLGLNFDQPPPLPTTLPFFYTASGTWATPFQGPQF